MTPTNQKICKNCRFGKEAGYRQVICGKKNEWQPELYSCEYFDEKEKKKHESC